ILNRVSEAVSADKLVVKEIKQMSERLMALDEYLDEPLESDHAHLLLDQIIHKQRYSMATNEETNAAGTDTRPPMLVENDYESWKIRIHRYIRGKPNGKLIWKSIQDGPTPHPMVTDPPPANSTVMPAPRKKLDSEFNDEENKLEMADTQAEIILSQGLPRHIFNILNQTSTAQEIWNNVELLMQGSGRTLQQRKEDLFDEYERFRAIGNESIHDYFVRFHKLVNDMKITQLNIPTHQMNTKFVNNL
ncbi:hypothetical protein Tco_1046001, partial [Tanacetum coccineum]